MEGESILQKILKGESRQFQDLKNYTAPFEKILGSDILKCIGKKPTEYEKLCKYGAFCVKLLRYCVEVLSKGKKQANGTQGQEDCFKCVHLGADLLSKLVTSGITLPSEISVSVIIKLFFHLIINALKDNSVSHLPHITSSLVNITRAAMKSGQYNIIKDSTGLCKQISDHLWNAAIRLPKSMDKSPKALLALALRENSIDLLAIAKFDLRLVIERGLLAGRQFQLELAGSSEREEGRTFLLSFLSKVVSLIDWQLDKSAQVYSRLEDLCINCCKVTVTASHVHELLRSLNRLIRKDMKNVALQDSVFQSIIQVLLCALCFRLKEEKVLENYQYDLDLKWSAIQKRLASTSDVLRNLNSNLYAESQILLAVNYLRCILSKIFRTTAEESSDNLIKVPAEVLSAVNDLLLVCYDIQSHVVKTKTTSGQYISTSDTWEMIMQPRVAMLYLISSVILKTLNTAVPKAKTSQNGRKVPSKRDYVAIMLEGIKMLDDVVQDVPAALDQYVHLAFYAFNIALMLFNCGQINDATSLARLSCEAGSKWYLAKSDQSNAIINKVALYKKYELLSDCLEKQGHWLESVRTMSLCCQYYALSIDEFATKGGTDEKALIYVTIWSRRKDNAVKQLSDRKDIHSKLQRCNLDGDCRGVDGPSLNEEQICTLLKLELESYKKKGYCTKSDQLCVVEKLFNLYTSLHDETNTILMKLEKVKIMQHMVVQLDDASSSVSDGLQICEDLITDVAEMLGKQQESIMVKDILASAYFWRFVLQYSIAVQQTREDGNNHNFTEEKEPASSDIKMVNSLCVTPTFLLSLHSAVNLWTEVVNEVVNANKKLDVYSQSETRWMLQIASSVYGFLNMPLIRIHTLLVLATFARRSEDNECVVVSNSLAMQVLCEEGNIPCAELLNNDCEETISKLGEDCRAMTRYLFSLAKSQLFLCKGLYDEGWQIVKAVLDELEVKEGSSIQFVFVKAKLLCVRYLSLPTSLCKASFEDADGSNYFDCLQDSSNRTQALVNHFVDNGSGIELADLTNHEQERAVFLSHWSLLSELCCCLMEIGKVYLLQGAVREAKRYLEDGRETARRFLSANRFLEFTIQLAELNIVLNEAGQCKAYLEDAISMMRPDVSLPDILDKPKMFNVENGKENSSFDDFDDISAAQLQIKLITCYCQYLKFTGNISDAKKVISLLHDLRQSSVEQYKHTLDSLERIFAVTFANKCGEEFDERLCTAGKRNTKAKSKRGKTTTKRNERETISEFIPCKADIASLVFLKSCLTTYSLDGDNALWEGDFPRLLTTVQAGLDMVQWAQGIVNDPFLLDFMSTSLLHYLQGVAHVLASKDGFESWRVAGCHSVLGAEKTDVAEISDVMSRLDLSLTTDKPTARKSRRAVHNDKEELDLFDEDYLSDQHSPVESKIKKRRRGRQKITAEPPSLARSKKTPASSRKAAPQTPLSSHSEDLPSATKLRSRKNRSCRKNAKLSDDALPKSSTKPTRNAKRTLCNSEAKRVTFETNVEESGKKEVRSSRKCKKSSRDLIAKCTQNEGEFDGWNVVEHVTEEDKDMTDALDSFNSSLKYLHPCYNPMLLTRICHSLVLCYGLTCPDKAAVYQNMAMATTLRHQAMNRSTKIIRKEKDKQVKDAIKNNQKDELRQLLESVTLDKDERRSVNQMLHLQTVRNTIGFKIPDDDVVECFKKTIDLLTDDLTVCTLSIVQTPDRENVRYLVITRLRKDKESIVLKLTLPSEEDEGDYMEKEFQTNECVVRDLSSIFRRNIISDFAAILRENSEISVQIKSNREWWSRREQVDNQLKRFVKRMEETWFGRWRGILSGRHLLEEDCSRLRSHVEDIQQMALKILGKRVKNEQLLEVLTDSYCHLEHTEVMKVLSELTGLQANCEQLKKFAQALSNFLDDNERDDNAACVTRGPVVLILDKAIQHLPFESMPILRDQEVSRMPSLEFVIAHLSLQKTTMSRVDTRQTFYVLNPRNDLANTEKRFSDWFLSEEGWKGVVGRPPSTTEFKEALGNYHLFLYMGHGNGHEFLKGDEVTKLYCQAVAVLMGCSSGKLIVDGQCDPRGMALNYLLSGCPAVVGNLWDVTDGGIDKFTVNLLRMWFKEGHKLSLAQCVVRSRNACKMKYMNGSAPVVYGMPVYTRTAKKQVELF